MTGIGAYFYIVWGIWLRYCLDGQQDTVKLDWPSPFFSVPQIVKVSGAKGHTNGKAANGKSVAANGTSRAKKEL
jgi:dihydroceramidase